LACIGVERCSDTGSSVETTELSQQSKVRLRAKIDTAQLSGWLGKITGGILKPMGYFRGLDVHRSSIAKRYRKKWSKAKNWGNSKDPSGYKNGPNRVKSSLLILKTNREEEKKELISSIGVKDQPGGGGSGEETITIFSKMKTRR